MLSVARLQEIESLLSGAQVSESELAEFLSLSGVYGFQTMALENVDTLCRSRTFRERFIRSILEIVDQS